MSETPKIPHNEWVVDMKTERPRKPTILYHYTGSPGFTDEKEATDYFKRTIDLFGCVVAGVESSIHTHPLQTLPFKGAVRALRDKPEGTLWLSHKLFTPHTKLGPWVQDLVPDDVAGSRFLAYMWYLERCVQGWNKATGLNAVGTLIDHPPEDLIDPKKDGAWAYIPGNETHNSLVTAGYEKIFQALTGVLYAYGIPMWNVEHGTGDDAVDFGWYEGDMINPGMSLYFGSNPTMATWLKQFKQLLSVIPAHQKIAVWFDLRKNAVDEVVYFMGHPLAQRVAHWIMWPHPGTFANTDPKFQSWLKVYSFFDALRKAGLR